MAVNLTFILVRLVLRRSSSTYSLYIMYFLTAALAGWIQLQLESVGKPIFDERGGIIQSGSDLAQAGVTEYMFDILYSTWAIQMFVAFTTGYAWWLYLVVYSHFLGSDLFVSLDTCIRSDKVVGYI
jgi:hypothetical protein